MIDIAVKNTSCIGAGVIGHSWATLFALNDLNDLNVVLQDLSQDILDRAREQIKFNLDILMENL
jgi:3-hydroxyacyl-CoA dehydrogenase